MKKFLFAAMMLIASLAIIGCGGGGDKPKDTGVETKPVKQVALLTEKPADQIIDSFRIAEKDGHYEIHGVKHGKNFYSASFDKDDRGTIYFNTNDDNAIIDAKFLVTDANDFDLGYKGGFLLGYFLVSIGLNQNELDGFFKEQGDYVQAEISKQNNSVNPTVDKEFKIPSAKLNKTIAVLIKSDGKELSYTVSVAK